MYEPDFDIAAACAPNPNYRAEMLTHVQNTEKSYLLSDCQEQLNQAGIPVSIWEFAEQDCDVIKCIMGGLLMFAPDKRVDKDAV